MKFNSNCIRDILIECEESANGLDELYIAKNDIPVSLSKYEWSELYYHLNQCKMSDLFDNHSGEDILGGFVINNLSPNGHLLLQNLQSNKIWKKILQKGVSSLPTLISLVLEMC